MNLSSGNNPQMNTTPTPVSQHPPTDASLSFEHYRSPLVNSYYTPNYATLRCSSVIQDPEDPPDVPPLPNSQTLHHSQMVTTSTPVHYRSLQNTPSLSPKSKEINLISYFPSSGSDTVSRKRYHTAPREKHRVK